VAAYVHNFLYSINFSFHHPLPAFQLKFDHGPALDPDPEVWILLTRHLDSQVTDNKRFMSLQVFLDDQENSSLAQQNYDSLDHGLPPLTAVNTNLFTGKTA
jgi:hypothetical protein